MFHRVLIVAVLLAAAPAAAQDEYAARRGALTGLSRIFGELHHIRRMCEPSAEADAWRDNMKRLIDLEQPAFDLRDEMVGAFNDGYRSAQARFDYCDRNAEDYAAARAAAGEALVANLSAPLYTATYGEDAEGVNVFRGVGDARP
ncbi:MAG: TIGR02301 family protein [Parvularculaceae bacterium]|nr:TIGR02301 family protein [Parvularculaceae bacterium]